MIFSMLVPPANKQYYTENLILQKIYLSQYNKFLLLSVYFYYS